MHYLRPTRGTLVAGLIVMMLLIASCGMQPKQSTNALDRLNLAPASSQVTPFGGVTLAPAVKVAPDPLLTLEQPLVADRVGARQVIHDLAPKQSLNQAQTQVQTQAQIHSLMGHHCSGD